MMIILAAVTAVTMSQLGEAAYISGRCATHYTTQQQTAHEKHMDALSPLLRPLYEKGQADSVDDPIPYAICVKITHDIQKELTDDQRTPARRSVANSRHR